MGRFTRQELEDAFKYYLHFTEVTSTVEGDDRHWTERFADLFTEDCVYFEHQVGTFRGQDAVRAWITKAMTRYPGSEFTAFPCVWHVIDEDNDRVIVYFQNRMSDPGDGKIYEGPNISIIHYAGNNRWSYQEDIYNPKIMHDAVAAWTKAKAEAETAKINQK